MTLDASIEAERLKDWKQEAGRGKPILALDVDSTIYDLVPSLCRAARELTGEAVDPAHIDEWDYLHNRFGGAVAERIFVEALRPDKCPERKLYPGAETIIKLLQRHGYEVRFITHNHDPDGMRPHVTAWLRSLFFGVEVDVMHSSEPKVDRLLELGAVGIVDDKPETLVDAVDAGLFAATILQPWNRAVVDRHEQMVGFGEWWELISLAHPFWQNLYARRRA